MHSLIPGEPIRAQKLKQPQYSHSQEAEPRESELLVEPLRTEGMRELSKDVVWARISFSLDPLAAQSMGYTTVGFTLRRGLWSFGNLSFSHCLLASGKGTRAGCPILPGQVAPIQLRWIF